MAGDYTQARNQAASEAVTIGNQLVALRAMEHQLMQGIAGTNDAILIGQYMEDLEETQKKIKTLKKEAEKPPAEATPDPVATLRREPQTESMPVEPPAAPEGERGPIGHGLDSLMEATPTTMAAREMDRRSQLVSPNPELELPRNPSLEEERK